LGTPKPGPSASALLLAEVQAFPQPIGIGTCRDAALDLLPGHERQLFLTLWVDQAGSGIVLPDMPHPLAPIPCRAERIQFLLDGDGRGLGRAPVDVALQVSVLERVDQETLAQRVGQMG
jgi:hypothetical protein